MKNIMITNLTAYLPENIVTNSDLSKIYESQLREKYPNKDLSNAIEKVCGIQERRYANSSEMTSDMATSVVSQIFAQGVNPEEIDAIIVATVTPDTFYPSVAATVMSRLGLRDMEGFDISAACSGFTYGVEAAAMRLSANFGFNKNRWKKILVVSSDCVSKTLNKYNYKTGILFGDAAVACIVQVADDTSEISGFKLRNTFTELVPNHLQDVYYTSPFGMKDGQKWEDLQFELDGHAVYKHGIKFTKDFVTKYCDTFDVNLNQYDYFIPHQANTRMLETLRSDLELREKLLINIQKVGNTVASSTPLCLYHFLKNGQFKTGEKIMLCSFGAGYTLGILDLEVV